jgi:hypothetical protein
MDQLIEQLAGSGLDPRSDFPEGGGSRKKLQCLTGRSATRERERSGEWPEVNRVFRREGKALRRLRR